MKKLLFISVTVLLSLAALEGVIRVLEAGGAWLGRRSEPAENRFITAKDPARVFERTTVEGRDLYVRTRHHWILGHQSFQAAKSENTYRVFCIGSSASMGWPIRRGTPTPACWPRSSAGSTRRSGSRC